MTQRQEGKESAAGSARPVFRKWSVYFDGNFWGHRGRSRAGKEIPVKKQFFWYDALWHIPAIYVCAKGLVIDFCIEVEPERIHSYIKKWNLDQDEEGSSFTKEERQQCASEHPLMFQFTSEVTLKRKLLHQRHSCGIIYIPEWKETSDFFDSEQVLEHYGLDKAKAWSIHRVAYPWATRKKPEMAPMRLLLSASPETFSSRPFQTPRAGQSVSVLHPLTKKEYILTAEKVSQSKLSLQHFLSDEMEYPEYYLEMTYRLSPDLSKEYFQVRDCKDSESPRRKRTDELEMPKASSSASVSVIGGADGPTSIFLAGTLNKTVESGQQTACSALHFAPVSHVEWQIDFKERMYEDITIEL